MRPVVGSVSSASVSGSATGDGSIRPSGTNSSGPSSDTVSSPAAAAIRSALRMECHAKNPATNVMIPPPHSAMRTPGSAYEYGPIDTDWSPPRIACVTQSQKSAHNGEMVSEIRRQRRTTV